MTPVYPSHEDAHKAGWFSRRHQTGEECRTAKIAWDDRHKRKTETAEVCRQLHDKHSVKELLVLLDARLGPEQGARKERYRLASRMEQEEKK